MQALLISHLYTEHISTGKNANLLTLNLKCTMLTRFSTPLPLNRDRGHFEWQQFT